MNGGSEIRSVIFFILLIFYFAIFVENRTIPTHDNSYKRNEVMNRKDLFSGQELLSCQWGFEKPIPIMVNMKPADTNS